MAAVPDCGAAAQLLASTVVLAGQGLDKALCTFTEGTTPSHTPAVPQQELVPQLERLGDSCLQAPEAALASTSHRYALEGQQAHLRASSPMLSDR